MKTEAPAEEAEVKIRETYPLMDAVACQEGWDDSEKDSIYARKFVKQFVTLGIKERAMILDEVGVRLHDRATRGQQLIAEERNHLEEWYRRLDEEEARQFTEAQSTSTHDKTRDDIDQFLPQLALSAQNDQLRRELEELHRQLALKRTAKSA